MIETNLDDMPSEYLGAGFQEGLLDAGAIDFFFSSVQMKKGRPGLLLSVLSDSEHLDSVNSYILEHTSTIGVRYYPVQRSILSRSIAEIETSLGKVQVKVVTNPSGLLSWKVEYDSLMELKRRHGLSLLQLQALLGKELSEKTWSK